MESIHYPGCIRSFTPHLGLEILYKPYSKHKIYEQKSAKAREEEVAVGCGLQDVSICNRVWASQAFPNLEGFSYFLMRGYSQLGASQLKAYSVQQG